jgi:hypothetical protein
LGKTRRAQGGYQVTDERVTREIILIDLSSLAYPLFHTAADPSTVSTDRPFAAVCCDAGKSFRSELAASYKANRPERDATLQHQILLAKEQLIADGYPVWAVPGFEADDLIATAVRMTLSNYADLSVIIVTADKDLLQLVGPRVKAFGATNGVVADESAVGAKFGVLPGQMRDYLTVVGDTADNIPGARDIGKKTAGDLLAKFGSLDALYEKLEKDGAAACGIKPAIAQSLKAFKASGAMETARKLVTLRDDVEIPFDTIFAERRPADAQSMTLEDEPIDGADDEPLPPAKVVDGQAPPAASDGTMAVREQTVIAPPADWERSLEPRTMRDARILADDMHKSRMFAAYGSPHAVLSTIMVGRELGVPAMAALRSIHNIEGRHSLSAALMVALVLKSGMAEYFEPEEFDEKHAIFVTKRRGARKEVRVEHTIDMAVTAQLMKKDSNWMKIPVDMLVARAQSRLARLVYPDVILNLYTPDELIEMSQAVTV